MAQFSHFPLQQSLYRALIGDPMLMAMLTGVYDRAPQHTAFPYVTLGESSGSDWSTKTTSGMEHQLTLHIWSRAGGRQEAALIMERLYTLLHVDFVVDGQALVLLRLISSEILLEDDGWTYHGQMRLRALLQADEEGI